MKIHGKLVDIHSHNIYPAGITVSDKKIVRIEKLDSGPHMFILPRLIDSHIHIESSMITPVHFH